MPLIVSTGPLQSLHLFTDSWQRPGVVNSDGNAAQAGYRTNRRTTPLTYIVDIVSSRAFTRGSLRKPASTPSIQVRHRSRAIFCPTPDNGSDHGSNDDDTRRLVTSAIRRTTTMSKSENKQRDLLRENVIHVGAGFVAKERPQVLQAL